MNTDQDILIGKPPEESYTEMVQIVYYGLTNGIGRLFGGKLMEWIDTIGAVVARRHANSQVVTAAVDTLRFEAPVPLNSTVVLKGRITYTGHTSMEVRVTTYVEHLTGERYRVNEAYLVFVSLDETGKPHKVPPLIPVTDKEKTAFEDGKRRQALRIQRRSERY